MAEHAVRISVTLPPDLLDLLDRAAEAARTSRSAVVARLLRARMDEEERELMIEGYRAMADENRRLAEEHLPAAAEVVCGNG